MLQPSRLPDGRTLSISTLGSSTCAPMSPPVGVFAKKRYGRRHSGWPSRNSGPSNPDIVRKISSVGAAIAPTTNHFDTPERPRRGSSGATTVSACSSISGGAIAVTLGDYRYRDLASGKFTTTANSGAQRAVRCQLSAVSCELSSSGRSSTLPRYLERCLPFWVQ